MKKFLSTLLAIITIFTVCATFAACAPSDPADEMPLGLSFKLSDDETYYIVTSYGANTATDVVIPHTYNDLPVKEIAPHAFQYTTNNPYTKDIKSIFIGDNVAIIGENAFSGCSSLSSVTVGAGVKEIGDYAFKDCSSLGKITLPNGLEKIGKQVFAGCYALTSANIPSTVTEVGQDVFLSCKYFINSTYAPSKYFNGVYIHDGWIIKADRNLTDVNLPDNAVGLCNNLFSASDTLNSVHIARNLKYVGENAFKNCTVLSSVYYELARENWDAIEIASGNLPLTTAEKHWYSV